MRERICSRITDKRNSDGIEYVGDGINGDDGRAAGSDGSGDDVGRRRTAIHIQMQRRIREIQSRERESRCSRFVGKNKGSTTHIENAVSAATKNISCHRKRSVIDTQYALRRT